MKRRRALTIATAALGWLAFALSALAASPTPAAEVGDPRSSGQGPGLVGDPGVAILLVSRSASARSSRPLSMFG